MDLQRKAGNRATVAFLEALQPKLAVGAADDRYEREADCVALEVISRLRSGADSGEVAATPVVEEAGAPSVPARSSLPARKVSRLQRKADVAGPEGGELDQATEASISAARSGGSPLPGSLRRSMEGAFGADFGGVKLHSGAESESLNHQVGAVAFTVGSDIFLGRSAPDPSSRAGQDLLAHELTHTIQQGGSHPRPEKA
jgi:hypothetical protein